VTANKNTCARPPSQTNLLLNAHESHDGVDLRSADLKKVARIALTRDIVVPRRQHGLVKVMQLWLAMRFERRIGADRRAPERVFFLRIWWI
jgi:hypothetical protein